jgi:hypothetical protein
MLKGIWRLLKTKIIVIDSVLSDLQLTYDLVLRRYESNQ